MTNEEILENNELIAKFIGESFPMSHITDYKKGLPININKKYLKYHKSWNQLMPVVKKISQLYNQDIHGGGIIYELTVFANCNDVYLGVIEFIKWYNDNRN